MLVAYLLRKILAAKPLTDFSFGCHLFTPQDPVEQGSQVAIGQIF
jgi:hypothetical protein